MPLSISRSVTLISHIRRFSPARPATRTPPKPRLGPAAAITRKAGDFPYLPLNGFHQVANHRLR